MNKYLIFLLLPTLFFVLPLTAQINLSYYLPNDITYDEKIPTPKSVLGYEVGDWHVNHDQLLKYMEAVAAASDRVRLEYYGKSYEDRALMLLTITSASNQNNLEEIRKNHVNLSNPSISGNISVNDMPAVVWLGYSVHGNESSGTNASLLTVYHLAAAKGVSIDNVLKNTVILIDPMINPDGNMRFSGWVNSRRSKNLVTDPQNQEQNEPWPGGRTNHYWFDLNRDWLLLQHPESKGRLQKFHHWKPNILTDHHEMGTNASFFFQPGIPSRNNPRTPQNTFVLTDKIAKYHEKALDEIGSLYYAKESFDDYYYGKGSTYPDVNAAVGILFEQASSRSHAQESINGILKFPFTIKNQFVTSMSTITSAQDLRIDLLEHQKTFYKESIDKSRTDAIKAIVIGNDNDPVRLNAFADVLTRHQIDVYELKRDINANNYSYKPDHSYIVPLNQPQYRLIKAIFERRTSFQDSLFYDVSAWTLPLAYNLPFAELTTRNFNTNVVGEKATDFSIKPANQNNDRPTYAYGINWDGYFAPRSLFKLLQTGIRAKVATAPFTNNNGQSYDYGTIIVPLKNQDKSEAEIHAMFDRLKNEDGIEVYSFNTGAASSGVYLGSNKVANIQLPKIAILVGNGVTSYDAGEIWHLLDDRFDMTHTLLKTSSLSRVDLSRYNTIIMANGSYSSINNTTVENLKNWVKKGGKIIAMRGASRWLANKGITKTKFVSNKSDTTSKRQFADKAKYSGAQVIGGAIFETTLDLTHPITYGYNRTRLPVFKKGSLFMQKSGNPYANPINYTANSLMSGYISDKNLSKVNNSPAVQISNLGRGKIISFTDNPNFRAYWYGTSKMFFNSIYFGGLMSL